MKPRGRGRFAGPPGQSPRPARHRRAGRRRLPASLAVHRALTAALLVLAMVAATATTASARARPYTPCEKTGGAIIVEVSGATCDDARAVASALAGVPADGVQTVLLGGAGRRCF